MELSNIQIRESNEPDFNDIMEVEKEAFGNDKEAELVAQLLDDITAEPLVSLLAFLGNKAIGHILFTKAIIEGSNANTLLHILAPLAVMPEYQRKGVGGLLINEGLRRLKEIGSEVVFVLGHKEYYPKYGFIPDAGRMGFSAPYPIPAKDADAWMVQVLEPEGFNISKGKVICSNELNRPEHWRE